MNVKNVFLEALQIGASEVDEVISSMKHCVNQPVLNFKHHKLNLKVLAKNLKKCKNLQILDVGSNEIDDRSAEVLVNGLSTARSCVSPFWIL